VPGSDFWGKGTGLPQFRKNPKKPLLPNAFLFCKISPYGELPELTDFSKRIRRRYPDGIRITTRAARRINGEPQEVEEKADGWFSEYLHNERQAKHR
jgi:hypothetical protein